MSPKHNQGVPKNKKCPKVDIQDGVQNDCQNRVFSIKIHYGNIQQMTITNYQWNECLW